MVVVMRHWLVMADVNDGRVLVDRRRAVRGRTVAVRVIVMLDGIAAGIAGMRAKDRDQARENRADQGQKDDCLDHLPALWRMIFSENRFTLFRIMLNPSSD